MLLVAVGFILWNQNPTVEVMEFGDDDIFEYDIVEATEPEAEPDLDAAPTPKPRAKPRPVQPEPVPEAAEDVFPRVVPKPSLSDLPKWEPRGPTRGEVISDPAAIFKMIGKEMKKQQQTLNQCYSKQLKTKPGLQGRWRAKFVVNPRGVAENVTFTGVQTHDAEFESCLAATLGRWKFRKISRPQPVEKSWRFRPN